jgi:hypothetical protein
LTGVTTILTDFLEYDLTRSRTQPPAPDEFSPLIGNVQRIRRGVNGMRGPDWAWTRVPLPPVGSGTLVLQSGITRFQSQGIKTWESWRRLLESGGRKANTAAGFYAENNSMGDAVRFIGTDVPYVVREYNPESLEYRVPCGDDSVSSQWASEIYFELINPVRLAADD